MGNIIERMQRNKGNIKKIEMVPEYEGDGRRELIKIKEKYGDWQEEAWI